MQAAITGPYSPDADTVHLFHLDQAAGESIATNSVPAAASAIAFDGNPILNHSSNPQPAATGILGASSGFTGFNSAASLSAADLGIGLDANGSGGFQIGTATASPDAIAHSTLSGPGGAFTLEALIKLPEITGTTREILCTDSAFANRGFQFRIGTGGTLEFNFIATTGAAVTAPIPLTGTHAFNAANWYHVAVTHNGPPRSPARASTGSR